MALFAAGNINAAVNNFADRGYAKVKGIILNRRNVEREFELVSAFAEKAGLPILADIPRDKNIQSFENIGKTVIEGDPNLPISQKFFEFADFLMRNES